MSRRTRGRPKAPKTEVEPQPQQAEAPEADTKEGAKISLTNPMREHYKAFVVGNATMCQRVVEKDSAKGQHIVICGAGPSLAETADEWVPQGDQVWGCNSALTWLYDNGYPVTHGFTVDQQPQMIDEWKTAPPVDYILASTVHPSLTEHLHENGRRTHFFHNYVGIHERNVTLCECGHPEGAHEEGPCKQCDCTEYREKVSSFEDWIYALLFDTTVKAGSGLNTATRAIDVALFMGASKVTLLGADCALRLKCRLPEGVSFGSPDHTKWLEENTIMHADGGHALRSGATPVTLGAEIDGRWWESKPDLILSAIWLVHMARELPELNIVGDTLPNALLTQSPEFLARLPSLATAEGDTIDMVGMLRQSYGDRRKTGQEEGTAIT
jgi:hypothetical protein